MGRARRRGLVLAATLFLHGTALVAAEDPLPSPGIEDPKRRPGRSAPLSYWCRARQILVSFSGARRGVASRSRAEALARAEALVRLARDQDRDFAALARSQSDGRGAASGGAFGSAFRFDQVDEAFARAAYALAPGQISDPVETPYGFHIILREPLREFGVQRILVPSGDDELAALTRAEALLVRARAGEDFVALGAPLGGYLGIAAAPLIEREAADALASTAPGRVVSEVIESVDGFLILRHLSPELVRGSHILIDFKGAFRSRATRTREEARSLATSVLAKLGSGLVTEADFRSLAKERSVLARIDLGPVPRRGPQMDPELRATLFAASPGRMSSKLAESRFGFHVVWRAP